MNDQAENASPKQREELSRIADLIGRDAMHRILEFFGQHVREDQPGGDQFPITKVKLWMAKHCKIESSEIDAMSPSRVAEIVAFDARQLEPIDRRIMEAFNPGEVLTTQEIADRVGEKSMSTVSKRLMDAKPLKRNFWVLRSDSGKGFYRRIDLDSKTRNPK